MLRRMVRVGVATRVGRRWFVDPSPDWDAVARRCRTAGRLARRATLHREAREAHRAYLQQRDELTARINALCDPVTRTASFGAPPSDWDPFGLADIGPAEVDVDDRARCWAGRAYRRSLRRPVARGPAYPCRHPCRRRPGSDRAPRSGWCASGPGAGPHGDPEGPDGFDGEPEGSCSGAVRLG